MLIILLFTLFVVSAIITVTIITLCYSLIPIKIYLFYLFIYLFIYLFLYLFIYWYVGLFGVFW